MRNGTRVQLHAATDHWMRGDRYGEVIGLGRAKLYRDSATGKVESVRPYRVRLDKSGRVVRLHPDWLFEV